ncbi:RNA export factor NXT1 [Phaffia rhodozyma]|uniref:RNA export factor NXT1 n=1 Tax=Phaffia rhodozyma TaxID=264483 RepID=A0A0F7SHL6_PHARH|nr:RNA export factor NXT1 [Phaffia rhodozyma]
MTDVATVDIACRGARDFVRTYFISLDSEARSQLLPRLHRPSSITTWNGTPLAPELLADFFGKLPESRHDIQCIDVHPVLGTTPAPLQVTTTGSVLYFFPSTPSSTPTPNASSLLEATRNLPPQNVTEYKKPKTPDDVERLPRAFHASFLLLPDSSVEGAGLKYYIGSAMYRFVG